MYLGIKVGPDNWREKLLNGQSVQHVEIYHNIDLVDDYRPLYAWLRANGVGALTSIRSAAMVADGEWHHVAMTYDGEKLTFYLDGEPDGGGLLPGPLVPNSNNLFIGADFPGGDEFWDGALDEVKIWNVALKQTHVQASMNGAAAPLAKNLVGFWRFNEGDGDIAYDKSNNGNDGALINGPTWIYP